MESSSIVTNTNRIEWDNETQFQQQQQLLNNQQSANNGNPPQQEKSQLEMDNVNMDDQDSDNNTNWVTVVNRIRRYKASVNVNNLTDNSINSKIAIVQSAVGDLEDYFGTKIFFQGRERFITVEFGKKKACWKHANDN